LYAFAINDDNIVFQRPAPSQNFWFRHWLFACRRQFTTTHSHHIYHQFADTVAIFATGYVLHRVHHKSRPKDAPWKAFADF